MGMYTELKLTLHLPLESRKLIEKLHNYERANQHRWTHLANEAGCSDLLMWSKFDRCDFIPFGGSAYFDQTFSTLTNGTWDFQCNLKNYNDEILWFIRIVIPFLKAQIICGHVHYEEHEKPTDIFEYIKQSDLHLVINRVY